jgi:hypothetical protein
MFQSTRPSFLGLLLLCAGLARAQVSVTLPVNRMVFQRGIDNVAAVPIQGNCPANTTRLEAKATALNGGQSVNWTTVATTVQGTRFAGQLSLTGGWYQLEVRAWAGSAELGTGTVGRVGVGEVFIVAGQSNALGGAIGNTFASDDRVSTVNQDAGLRVDERQLSLQFSQMGPGTVMAPKNPTGVYGQLGDLLVARLQVPVLFLGAAYSGSSSNDWRVTALGQDKINYRGLDNMTPYRALGVALNYYAKQTGVRAVLWHQGESDNGYQTKEGYVDNLTKLIAKARQQAGLPNLGWAVSLVSRMSDPPYLDANIIDAQKQVIASTPNVFVGAQTDNDANATARPDGLHFGGPAGYTILANRWLEALTPAFFQNCQPSLPVGSVPAIMTGYSAQPHLSSGQTTTVPFMSTLSANTPHTVQLLGESNNVVATLATGTGTGIEVTIPTVPTGRYRFRVVATDPATTGNASEVFTINDARRVPQMLGGMPPTPIDGSKTGSVRLKGFEVETNFVSPDGSALTFSVAGLPAGFSANGLIVTSLGSSTVVGNQPLFITATSANGLSTYVSGYLNITAAAPPTVTPPATPTPPATVALAFEVMSYDCQTGLLTYRVVGGSGGQAWLTAHGVYGGPVTIGTTYTHTFPGDGRVGRTVTGSIVQGNQQVAISYTNGCSTAPTPTPPAVTPPTSPTVTPPTSPTVTPPTVTQPATPTVAAGCNYTDNQQIMVINGNLPIFARYHNGVLYACLAGGEFLARHWLHDIGYDASKRPCFAEIDPRISPTRNARIGVAAEPGASLFSPVAEPGAGLSIYPNPTDGQLTVRFSQALSALPGFTLINAMGRVEPVSTALVILDAYTVSLSVAHLPGGRYTLQARNEAGLVQRANFIRK